jgi:aldose 1-epimerase
MNKPDREYCFTHPGGEDIYLFTLRNSKGTEVCITNYGATITSFRLLQKDGTVNDIVLGFDKPEEYLGRTYLEANPYFGAAIGRYGNRIKNGKFSIDGKEYSVEQNLGADHLHGGITGFDKKVWTPFASTADSVVLKYESKDGEEGYPGNLDTTLKFELTEENELSLEYAAFTDLPTPVNLSHHSYFNLNNGKAPIDEHFIKINSAAILEQDAQLTVTGKFLPVNATSYDFRQFKKINTDWNPATGYDQSFVVGDIGLDSPAAEAYSEKSGIKLQVFTTEPIVHLYTGKSIPPLSGKNGHPYGPFSGFCLETQVHPNAVNIPHFQDTILRPGKEYMHKTIYKVIN